VRQPARQGELGGHEVQSRHAEFAEAGFEVGGLEVVRLARGSRAVAEGTVALRERSRFAAVALVDGDVGLVVASGGRLVFALTVTVEGGRITAYDVVAEPGRLRRGELGVLDPPCPVSSPSPTR
jgi:hypothetical protein